MATAALIDPAPYRERLERRLHELQARLRGIESSLDEPPNADFGERATEREGDEVLESLGAAGLSEIRMIEAALARIAEGEFGYCVNCGEPIARERLEVVPHAARCRKCA
jgi:RNA polymerase-binding transcription factor DksA